MSYKLLLVEDEFFIRDRLKMLLKTIDLPIKLIHEAENGVEALKIIEDEIPDIIISDVKMPLMGGIELAAQIAIRYPLVKIIILSGYAEFDYACQAFHAGVVEYVLKPADAESLKNALEKALAAIQADNERTETVQRIHQLEKSTIDKRVAEAFNQILYSEGRDILAIQQIDLLMPYLKDSWFSLLVADIRNQDNQPVEQSETARHLLPGASRQKDILLFENVKSSREMLILLWEETPEKTAEKAETLAKRLIALESSEHFCKLTIGLSGTESGISRLSRCYEQAKCALLTRLSKGHGRLYCFGKESAVLSWRDSGLSCKLQALEVCLRESRRSSEETLRLLIADLFLRSNLEKIEGRGILLLYREIIGMLIRYCLRYNLETSDIISESMINGDILYHFSSLSDISKHLVELIMKLQDAAFATDETIPHLIQQLKNYIQTYFYEDINLYALAQKRHVDFKHLSKMFKLHTGQTFSDYLSEVRFEKALELLRTTSLNIQEISESVGYTDHQYFHRLFKKKFGVTPNVFRLSQKDQNRNNKSNNNENIVKSDG